LAGGGGGDLPADLAMYLRGPFRDPAGPPRGGTGDDEGPTRAQAERRLRLPGGTQEGPVMDRTCDLYDALAGRLAYPRPGYHATVADCQRVLTDLVPEAGHLVAAFGERIAGLAAEDLEELYTRTFDLNPVCSLEVGWHLFGENYSRGEFLVRMRQEL